MPQVDGRVAKQRASRLRALGEAQFTTLAASRVGKVESVLVERGGIGRQEQFIPVSVSVHSQGQIVPIRITGVSANGLVGEPVRAAA